MNFKFIFGRVYLFKKIREYQNDFRIVGLVGNFEVEEAANTIERFSSGDRRHHFIADGKFRLELKTPCRVVLYTEYHALINSGDERGLMTP